MTDTKHSADLPPLPDRTKFYPDRLGYSMGFTADQMREYARAAIASAAPAGEPVAWGLLSIQEPELTNDHEIARYWWRKGRMVTPLYAAPVPAAAPDHSLPTDISDRLRSCADAVMLQSDRAKLMRTAADECERFYGGMMNWKANAQQKDKTIIELREKLAAMPAAAPKAALTPEQIKALWGKESMGQFDSRHLLFARAIEAASGPNAALATALEQLIEHCDNVGACGMAIEDARAALAAAGEAP